MDWSILISVRSQLLRVFESQGRGPNVPKGNLLLSPICSASACGPYTRQPFSTDILPLAVFMSLGLASKTWQKIMQPVSVAQRAPCPEPLALRRRYMSRVVTTSVTIYFCSLRYNYISDDQCLALINMYPKLTFVGTLYTTYTTVPTTYRHTRTIASIFHHARFKTNGWQFSFQVSYVYRTEELFRLFRKVSRSASKPHCDRLIHIMMHISWCQAFLLYKWFTSTVATCFKLLRIDSWSGMMAYVFDLSTSSLCITPLSILPSVSHWSTRGRHFTSEYWLSATGWS